MKNQKILKKNFRFVKYIKKDLKDILGKEV